MSLAVAGIDHQPLVVGFGDQGFQQFLPNSFVPPADKAAVRVAPAAIFRRQIAPRRTRAQNPENRIDKQAIVLGDAALGALAPRQVRLQQGPCFIGNIMTAVGGCWALHTDLLLGSADSPISSIS